MSAGEFDGGHVSLNCIAFYKGDQISDWLLRYIVNAAYRGQISEAGKNLWLIPIKVYEKATRDQQAKADAEARRRRKRGQPCNPGPAAPSIKKRDCIPLTSFLPKTEEERKRRNQQFAESGPLVPMPPHPKTVTPVRDIEQPNNRNSCGSCGESLAHRRKGAKYCSKACKQAAFRARTKGRAQ